jgi:hypothetical protein
VSLVNSLGSTTARNVLRLLGVVVLVAGLTIFIVCGKDVLHDISASDDMNSPEFAAGPPVGKVLGTMGGFLMMGVGLQLLYLGFLRAQARYLAAETSPAVATVAEAFNRGATANGPYCASCGTRNDRGARFCDACGKALTGP